MKHQLLIILAISILSIQQTQASWLSDATGININAGKKGVKVSVALPKAPPPIKKVVKTVVVIAVKPVEIAVSHAGATIMEVAGNKSAAKSLKKNAQNAENTFKDEGVKKVIHIKPDNKMMKALNKTTTGVIRLATKPIEFTLNKSGEVGAEIIGDKKSARKFHNNSNQAVESFEREGVQGTIEGAAESIIAAPDVLQKTVKEVKVASVQMVDIEAKMLKDFFAPVTGNVKFLGKLNQLIDRAATTQLAYMNFGANVIYPVNAFKVDTYRALYDEVKHEIATSYKELNRFHNNLYRDLSKETIGKVSKYFDHWINQYFDIQEGAIDYGDAITSFDNVSRVVLVSAGSVVAGPLGSSIANILVDVVVLEKNLSVEDMAKTMAIGMAAGYAGEFASGFSKTEYISHMSSKISQNMTYTLADAGVNHKDLSSDDLIKVLILSASNLSIDNAGIEGLTNGAASSVLSQLLDTGSVHLDEVLDSSFKDGIDNVVNHEVSETIDQNISEEHKRLDRKLAKKVVTMFESANQLAENSEQLSLLEKEHLVSTLSKVNQEKLKLMIADEGQQILAAAAATLSKNPSQLTASDYNNPLFIQELQNQANLLENKLQMSSEIDSIFANSQMEPELRAPAGLLTSIIVLGLSTYTAYTAINEVREILNMPPGDARDKKLAIYAMSEAGYIVVGALSGAAILRVLPKVAKIFSRGRIIADSARKLGIKTKDGIAKLARIKQSKNATKGLSGAAKHDLYKKQLRSSMAKPKVQNNNLKQIIEDNYRPNAKRGSGSTADALRHEKLTGNPVGGKRHAIKSKQQVKRIHSWLKANKNASSIDRVAAEQVMLDMMEALGDI